MPAVEWEARSWRPRAEFEGYATRAEIRRQTGEYRSALVAEISDWAASLNGALAADIDDASRALVDFDTHAVTVLGKHDPSLGPMAAILLRTECVSSSQIEHLTTSARQLALAEIDEGDTSNAIEVIGNVRAMEAAVRLADRLDADAILDMHRELMRSQPSLTDQAGTFRAAQVWIGGRDSIGPIGADYIAPHHDQVRPAIDDLVRFMARDDLPPLAQIAIAHAQFETIHPFADGNGRTGRALAHALLRAKGMTRNHTVPISAGLLVDVDSYFDALGAYRDGDAAPIVRRFCTATRFAASTGRDLVDELASTLEASREQLAGVRPHAGAWRLLPKLISQPVVNVAYVKQALGADDNKTALRAVDVLAKRGVVVERTGRQRDRVWQHPGVLSALDAYAEKIRRAPRTKS